MFVRAIEIVQQEGFRTLGLRALAKIYRRMILVKRDLSEPTADAQAALPVTISLLSVSEIDEHIALRPSVNELELQRRLACGHRCFVARHNNAMVHVCWATPEKAELHYLGCDLELTAGDVYIYGSYTAQRYRNMNIAEVRGSYIANYFHGLGYSRFIAVVQPSNKAALRVVEKIGYRHFGIVGFVRFGPWLHYFHKQDEGLPFSIRPRARA